MKKLFLIVLIFVSLINQSCSSNDENLSTYQKSKKAKELFGRASILMNDMDLKDSLTSNKVMTEILKLGNEAILLDSNNYDFYNLLSVTFLCKRDLANAIRINELIVKRFPDNDFIYLDLGRMYQMTGQNEKSMESYRKLFQIYSDGLKQDPDFTPWLAQRAFLLIFLESQQVAIDEIDSLLNEYPDDNIIKIHENMIKKFNLKKYLAH